jgi:hypothetical protein
MGLSSLFLILSKSLCLWHNSCRSFFERLFIGIESSVMVNALAIRSSIGEFLAGEQGLDQFEKWLVGRTWNIHKSGEVESQVLAYEIELCLAEYHVGALSEQELRLELQHIANTFTDSNQESSVISASSTDLIHSPLSARLVGTSHVTASE